MQLIQTREEFPLLYVSPVVSHPESRVEVCCAFHYLLTLMEGLYMIPVVSVERLSAAPSFISVFCVTNNLHTTPVFSFICSPSFLLFPPHHSFYSPTILPLHVSSLFSPISFSCVSLCCRPVWISGNRSASGECHQEWLSSNWRYCSSNAFHCHCHYPQSSNWNCLQSKQGWNDV